MNGEQTPWRPPAPGGKAFSLPPFGVTSVWGSLWNWGISLHFYVRLLAASTAGQGNTNRNKRYGSKRVKAPWGCTPMPPSDPWGRRVFGGSVFIFQSSLLHMWHLELCTCLVGGVRLLHGNVASFSHLSLGEKVFSLSHLFMGSCHDKRVGGLWVLVMGVLN
jgi:hypothetical protein